MASEISLALAMKAWTLAQTKRSLSLPLMEFGMVTLLELPCAASHTAMQVLQKKTGLLIFPVHQMSRALVEHTSNPYVILCIHCCKMFALYTAPLNIVSFGIILFIYYTM